LRELDRSRRAIAGRALVAALSVFIAMAPYILFFDPVDYWPLRAHVAREPLGMYLLFSDDVAYVSAARNWHQTLASLFEPHNTHIVPAWRVLTFALVTLAGSLERLPVVLAMASYSILIAVMFLTARLVARETGDATIGLAAMALLGTSSVMLTPAIWYSAGQPLWAGYGILATLWYAQSYRRSGTRVTLVLAGVSALLAGWFWTIGHATGPAAAVYLWQDGRRRSRLAAIVPLVATTLSVGIALGLGGNRIDSTISFHGRDMRTAANPIQGLMHTCQAIPENLIFANLGLTVHTTASQGVLLTGLLVLAWTSRAWSRHRKGEGGRLFGPLESAGATMLIAAYAVEWTFRGYLDYQFLRTINMRFMVPWYDSIPQIGAILLLAGWWENRRSEAADRALPTRTKPPTKRACLGVSLLVIVLIVLNRPRVETFVRASVPPLAPSEREPFAIARLQTMRANVLLIDRALWQRRCLRRLDRAEHLAKRMGLGKDAIRTAFGHRFIPGSVAYVRPDQADQYDAVALLDLPDRGRPVDPASVRAALAEQLAEEPEPRPGWIAPNEKWPP
jgi:hypothetical protein